MTMGPIQVVVVAFEDYEFSGTILPELERLKEQGIIRVLDMIFVEKDEAGEVEALQMSQLGLEEREGLGAIAGALLGFGMAGEEGAELGALAGAVKAEEGVMFDEADAVNLADDIPPGTAVAVVLFEHQWAIPLKLAVRGSGGRAVADYWIQPEDLIALGAEAAEAMAAAEAAG